VDVLLGQVVEREWEPAQGAAGAGLADQLLLAGLAAGALLAIAMRETGERRPGTLASLMPNTAVPARARPMFVRVAPCLIALWALSGFYLAFSVPIVAAGIATTGFSTRDVALVFSASVAALAAIGTMTGLAARKPAPPEMRSRGQADWPARFACRQPPPRHASASTSRAPSR
jgi:hypothetical protein